MPNLAGQKTFLSMQGELAEIVLNSAAFSTTTNPNLVRAKQIINDSYREITTERDWWFLFNQLTVSTVVGQTTAYALDDTCKEIRYMAIPTNQQRLVYLPWEKWVNDFPGRYTNQGNARPWAYVPGQEAANNALQVYFFPAADAIYSVEYGFMRRVLDLSADTDVPIIPPEFQDCILLRAAFEIFHKVNDKRAAEWKSRYEERSNVMWLKNEQLSDYVNTFRNINSERAYYAITDVNRSLFVPY